MRYISLAFKISHNTSFKHCSVHARTDYLLNEITSQWCKLFRLLWFDLLHFNAVFYFNWNLRWVDKFAKCKKIWGLKTSIFDQYFSHHSQNFSPNSNAKKWKNSVLRLSIYGGVYFITAIISTMNRTLLTWDKLNTVCAHHRQITSHCHSIIHVTTETCFMCVLHRQINITPNANLTEISYKYSATVTSTARHKFHVEDFISFKSTTDILNQSKQVYLNSRK